MGREWRDKGQARPADACVSLDRRARCCAYTVYRIYLDQSNVYGPQCTVVSIDKDGRQGLSHPSGPSWTVMPYCRLLLLLELYFPSFSLFLREASPPFSSFQVCGLAALGSGTSGCGDLGLPWREFKRGRRPRWEGRAGGEGRRRHRAGVDGRRWLRGRCCTVAAGDAATTWRSGRR